MVYQAEVPVPFPAGIPDGMNEAGADFVGEQTHGHDSQAVVMYHRLADGGRAVGFPADIQPQAVAKGKFFKKSPGAAAFLPHGVVLPVQGGNGNFLLPGKGVAGTAGHNQIILHQRVADQIRGRNLALHHRQIQLGIQQHFLYGMSVGDMDRGFHLRHGPFKIFQKSRNQTGSHGDGSSQAEHLPQGAFFHVLLQLVKLPYGLQRPAIEFLSGRRDVQFF